MFSFRRKETEQKPFEVRTPETGSDSKLDIYSPTWQFIREWAETSLEELRAKNDNTNLDVGQTAVLRGKIKKLKELLALPDGGERKGILNR